MSGPVCDRCRLPCHPAELRRWRGGVWCGDCIAQDSAETARAKANAVELEGRDLAQLRKELAS